MTRLEIKNKIERNLLKIEELKSLNTELYRESLMLSDSEQWFEEKIESNPKRKWARKENYLDGKLVGRIFWNEDFIDESTGDVVTIERQQVVKIDGKWI